MQQKLDFTSNTIHQINIYHEAERTESKTDGMQLKLSPTQKEAIKNIIREYGIDGSTFLRDALNTYLEIFPYKDKLLKHKDLLAELINRLL